jgi:hypothetical protein
MDNSTAARAGGGALLLIILLVGVCYLIPTIIGVLRGHKDLPAIAVVNILFGWSVVGWFISFIWSLADPAGRGRGTQTVVINTAQHNVSAVPPDPLRSPVGGLPSSYSSRGSGDLSDDRDTVFWDGLADKNDPDLLEEYLIRFPNGRFAQLARSKLDRAGGRATRVVSSAPLGLAPPVASPGKRCRKCGAQWDPDSRFCSECGVAAEAGAGA